MKEISTGDLERILENSGAILYPTPQSLSQSLGDLPASAWIAQVRDGAVSVVPIREHTAGTQNWNTVNINARLLASLIQQLTDKEVETLVIPSSLNDEQVAQISEVAVAGGITCVYFRVAQDVTMDDFMAEEDTDEVAKRLRALGYL